MKGLGHIAGIPTFRSEISSRILGDQKPTMPQICATSRATFFSSLALVHPMRTPDDRQGADRMASNKPCQGNGASPEPLFGGTPEVPLRSPRVLKIVAGEQLGRKLEGSSSERRMRVMFLWMHVRTAMTWLCTYQIWFPIVGERQRPEDRAGIRDNLRVETLNRACGLLTYGMVGIVIRQIQ